LSKKKMRWGSVLGWIRWALIGVLSGVAIVMSGFRWWVCLLIGFLLGVIITYSERKNLREWKEISLSGREKDKEKTKRP